MFRAALTALAIAMLSPLAAQADDRNDGNLSPDFEGQVAYFGNYTGKTSVTADQRRRDQGPCPYQDQRCYQQVVGGGVKVVLSFDGEHVTGFYYSVGGFEGPNGLREGTLIGRRTREPLPRRDRARQLFAPLPRHRHEPGLRAGALGQSEEEPRLVSRQQHTRMDGSTGNIRA